MSIELWVCFDEPKDLRGYRLHLGFGAQRRDRRGLSTGRTLFLVGWGWILGGSLFAWLGISDEEALHSGAQRIQVTPLRAQVWTQSRWQV